MHEMGMRILSRADLGGGCRGVPPPPEVKPSSYSLLKLLLLPHQSVTPFLTGVELPSEKHERRLSRLLAEKGSCVNFLLCFLFCDCVVIEPWACMEAKLQVRWTLCIFWVLGLGLGLALLVALVLCCFGYRLCGNCCWALMAWLCATKFCSCCLIIRASSSVWAL